MYIVVTPQFWCLATVVHLQLSHSYIIAICNLLGQLLTSKVSRKLAEGHKSWSYDVLATGDLLNCT